MDYSHHVPQQWPRGMRLSIAAAYIGLSESAFRSAVKAGHLPEPRRVTCRRDIWLKEELDKFLDELFDVRGEDKGDDWLRSLEEAPD